MRSTNRPPSTVPDVETPTEHDFGVPLEPDFEDPTEPDWENPTEPDTKPTASAPAPIGILFNPSPIYDRLLTKSSSAHPPKVLTPISGQIKAVDASGNIYLLDWRSVSMMKKTGQGSKNACKVKLLGTANMGYWRRENIQI